MRLGNICPARKHYFELFDKIMTILLQLDEEQSKRLQALADQLHVDPSVLAKAAINDMISRPGDDFIGAAQRVLNKNQELYRRLS